MLDITLIENLNSTFSNLIKENFIIGTIKLKVLDKSLKKIYYVSYKDYNEFLLLNNNILSTKGPTKYCTVGDYPFLENIQIFNKNTNYNLEFYFFNLLSENPIIRDSSTFSIKLNNFILEDKQKYKKYLSDTFIQSNNKSIQLGDYRLSTYVDACYVNIDYVQNENVPFEKSIVSKIKTI